MFYSRIMLNNPDLPPRCSRVAQRAPRVNICSASTKAAQLTFMHQHSLIAVNYHYYYFWPPSCICVRRSCGVTRRNSSTHARTRVCALSFGGLRAVKCKRRQSEANMAAALLPNRQEQANLSYRSIPACESVPLFIQPYFSCAVNQLK